MRFLSTIAAGILATVASAQEPITEPFFLTFVSKNGTEYPATIGEASRGIKILSAWTEYNQKFAYDVETRRLSASDHPEWGPNVGIGASSPVLFTYEVEEDAWLEQITLDGATYIVEAGAGENGPLGWNAPPAQGGMFNNVYWTGVGYMEANVALRIDIEKPVRRH
ncbi:hypothetical protein ACO1O0_007189 [Amphichorda felina]